jgi:K+-transporting ATPase ATPase A chain
MNRFDVLQVLFTFGVLIAAAPLLGKFFFTVYEGQQSVLTRPFAWLEKLCQKSLGSAYDREMDWRGYLGAVLIFNALGVVLLFLLQVLQVHLPFNPLALPSISWHLAFNTAMSFVTNTNWQSYSGENTLSYFVQFFGLTVQNFLSAASGMAVAVALCRALAPKSQKTLGNFWADLTRGIVYILLPLSILLTLVLVSNGVIQNFSSAEHATTLSGVEQIIPMGPAASQIAIKQLGTNGGGYFNANSAHPFENPTPFSNWLELISILLIPAGFAFLYGRITGRARQGRLIFWVMFTLLAAGVGISLYAEYQPISALGNVINLEGKETRIGVTGSVLWSMFTTVASNGSVNSMMSSMSPITGGISMLNIMLGEIIFGGVGSGLYGMLIFVLLTVFISGLMVGRTPEYLGKKVEAREIQMAVLAILIPSACVLIGTAIALSIPEGLSSLSSKGPHSFSEILYAFTSAANNNGSAFAGLNANTPFYNVALGIAMFLGRFGVIVPVMAIAGNMAAKKYSPPNAGTFNTDQMLFGVLMIAVILVVGGLTFFPALLLGPGLEHFLMMSGKTF